MVVEIHPSKIRQNAVLFDINSRICRLFNAFSHFLYRFAQIFIH